MVVPTGQEAEVGRSLNAWNVLGQQSLCEEEPCRMRAGFMLMNPMGDSLVLND